MRKFIKFNAILLIASGFSQSAKAENLDGYVGFLGGANIHLTNIDKVDGANARLGGKLDFVRLSRNIALDLRYGSGMDYTDFGAALKALAHFPFSQSSSTGLVLGLGLSGTSSSGLSNGSGESFYDAGAVVMSQFIFDLGIGAGMVFEAELNPVFLRNGSSFPKDSSLRNRFSVSAGFVINAI